jgi:effector-binding domain-containing protein
VTVTTVAPRLTAVVAQTTTWEQFPGLWPELLDEVYSVVRNQPHLGSTRGPQWQNVMLYKDDAPSVEIGVLAAAPVAAQGRVVASALPAGKTVMTTHRGDYAGLGRAHAAVHRFAELEHLVLQGPRWEIYGHHDDRREPETEVYYLLS